MRSRDGKQKLQLCLFSLFSLNILPFPYLGLSSPTSTASPLLLAVISLAPDFAKAANLWFKNTNALRKQAGKLTRETDCVILWTERVHLHQTLNVQHPLKRAASFFANLTVPPEHDDSCLLKESKLLYSTVVL